jgi:hypothetical protein
VSSQTGSYLDRFFQARHDRKERLLVAGVDKEQRLVNIAMSPILDRRNPDREIVAIAATDEFFGAESLYVF